MAEIIAATSEPTATTYEFGEEAAAANTTQSAGWNRVRKSSTRAKAKRRVTTPSRREQPFYEATVTGKGQLTTAEGGARAAAD